MNCNNGRTMMTYYPTGHRSSNGQFKLFSTDSRRRRRAASLFHKNSSMKRSWLVLSYPSLKYNSTSTVIPKQRSSSSSKSNPNHYSSFRPTTSCSIYSSYRSPSSSVIDSPVIYPKINPPTSSNYSFESSGNCSPLSNQDQLAETLLPCFQTTICSSSTRSESSPSSSILSSSSGSSPTSSSSISIQMNPGSVFRDDGKSIKNNNTFSNIIVDQQQHYQKESRIESGPSSSNKGMMMASNHGHDVVYSSDEQKYPERISVENHGISQSKSYNNSIKMGNEEENANEKMVSEERTSVQEKEKEQKERMNESALSSLTVTKTLSSSSTKSTHNGNNSVKGKNVSSKQGCSSKLIESSRELVQSLFYPSSTSSSSSLSKISHHPDSKSNEGEREYQKVSGGEKSKIGNFIVSKKEEEDSGQHSTEQYNNNYHEQRSEERNVGVGMVQVKSNRNNHHLTSNTNNKKHLARKLLVTKKNKNHIFYSPFNPHHPLSPTYSSPSSSFIIPIHRSTRYNTSHSSTNPPPHLFNQGMNSTDDNDHNQKQENNKHNFEQYGHQTQSSSCKPLPLLHFKDDEPAMANMDPSSYPGQEGSMTGHQHVDSKCKNCCKVKNGIKENKASYNGTLPPHPLNVAISQSSASSSFMPPRAAQSINNPSPPESLDSCSLFCSNSSSSNSTPSSSPTSASPTTISNSSPTSCSHSFQKQGILKTNKSISSTTTTGCNCVTPNCKLVATGSKAIHDHLEKLAITNDLNDKSGVVMIPSVHSASTNSSLDPSSPSTSSCCSSSLNQVQSRTGSSSSSSGKKVHFADMCYERNYYNENEEEKRKDKERSKNEVDRVDINPTNHRSLSSSTDHHHSSSLVIISEKIIPGPKRCTFKEISV